MRSSGLVDSSGDSIARGRFEKFLRRGRYGGCGGGAVDFGSSGGSGDNGGSGDGGIGGSGAVAVEVSSEPLPLSFVCRGL